MYKFLKYLVSTPLSIVVEDFKAYNTISKECKDLRRDYVSTRMELVALYNAEKFVDNKDKISCISRKIYASEDRAFPFKINSVVSKSFCPKFTPAYSEKACECKDCPCVEKNHKYNLAMQKYNAAVCKKNAFWEEKFQNLK